MSTLAHAKYGASSSDRWMNCAASTALAKQAPPQKGSAYAQEGTDAHSCLEALLKVYIMSKGNPAKTQATLAMLEKKYPDDMIEHAHTAFLWIINYYRTLVGGVPGVKSEVKLLCETRVDLPVSEPDQFGTVDAALVELFGKLVVIDFKYGAGVPVYPDENSQLIYYALGLAHQYDYNFSEVEIVIIQPRADVEGGPVRTWTTTVETLHEWREKFEAGIQASKDPCASYATGKWCRWCPAATICPEVSTRALAQAKIDFDPTDGGALGLPFIPGIAIPDLGTILTAADHIETWISKVREHAAHVLERGEKVEGWKLVAKRSTRKWVNAERLAIEAKKRIGSKAFSQPELLSPAQLEKATKDQKSTQWVAAWIAENTSNVSSGTTLAEESDKRPAVNPVEQDFAAISDERPAAQPETTEKGGSMAKKQTKKKTTKKRTTK